MAVVGSYGSGEWIILIPIALIFLRVFMRRNRQRGGYGYGYRNGQRRGPEPGSTYPGGSDDAVDAGSRTVGSPASGSAATDAGKARIPAGWMPDPSGRFDQRYWSGTAWTEHVRKDGRPENDPPPGSSDGGSPSGPAGDEPST